MSKEIDLQYGDKPAKGEQLAFEPEKEPWCVYTLEDGSTLKARTVVTQVVKVKDHFHPDGKQVYLINFSLMSVTEDPAKLLSISSEQVRQIEGKPND